MANNMMGVRDNIGVNVGVSGVKAERNGSEVQTGVSGVNEGGNGSGVNDGVKISSLYGRYFCIWECEKELERGREWEGVVKGYMDGLYSYSPGRVRFSGLLTFQVDVRLKMVERAGFVREMQGCLGQGDVRWC